MTALALLSRSARLCLAAWAFVFSASIARAQATEDMPVTLIADSVIVESETVLIAEGSVEVFSDGRRLTASRLTYDQEADRLTIDGPIVLTEGPDTVVLGDAAEMTTDLREGLVEGVRIILSQQVQIAAASAQRQQGRFTDLRNGVATSCEVCQPGDTPLWHIRAARIIHDEERQRIYFQHAQFRVFNIPIAYLPAISTPSPEVRRAQGFLVPSTRTSDLYGTGVRLPYFVPLGDHADLTFAPFLAYDLSGSYSRTLEARYRQAFVNGDIEFNGAVSQDRIENYGLRTYLFGEGEFELPWQTDLTFQIELVGDDAYLNDYDYSGADRLENSLALTRVVGNTRSEGELIVFHSLREDERNDEIPVLVGDARYDKRWRVPNAGFVDLSLIGHGHQRPSEENIIGRDMAQGRALLRWSDTVTGPAGLRLGAEARVMGDVKQIIQDDRYPEYQSALTPGLAATASLPMRKSVTGGASYLLEPMAQAVWVGDYDIESPNDDSTQPAFDAGNLLGFQRFPGLDRVEDGLRANLALHWQRFDPSGWTLGLTGGRVLRAESEDTFTQGTGLDGIRSDWLAQVDLDVGGLTLRNLALFDDHGTVSLGETRLGYVSSKFDVSAGYIWQENDPALNQDEDLSEVTLDGTYQFSDAWGAEMDLRRDLIAERSTRAGFALTYQNECVRVDLSGVRRFRNTEGAEPTYSYGLTVSLNGFGTGETAGKRRGRCS